LDLLIIAGVDIAHVRLVDLTLLADQAKPFYEWVETRFQSTLTSPETLNVILNTASLQDIRNGIVSCYQPHERSDLPFLFDGIGRTYPHTKACYYFFSWIIRDAPQQRLAPLIQKVVKRTQTSRIDVEIDVLSRLIAHYRVHVRNFTWEVVREVIIDRLEGSRRSLKGHEKEAVVRTALLAAIQAYYDRHKTYGIYAGIEIPDAQIMLENESYDVSVNLLSPNGDILRRMLVSIKTRETEGGGHSHLFTRDILSAIRAVRQSGSDNFLVTVIAAKNWSEREAETLKKSVDHLVLFDLAPGEFTHFDTSAQIELNTFMANVFDGLVVPVSAHE